MITNTPGIPEIEQEYFDAAFGALGSGDGAAALDSLGWWDLVADLDDHDLRIAAFTFFRAQGRRLASSPALGAVLAQPYLHGTVIAPGAVVAAVGRVSPRRGLVHLLVGDPAGRLVLVDRPGHGTGILSPDDMTLKPVDLPGGLDLYEVSGPWERLTPLHDEVGAARARQRSTQLGRVAIAFEMLGAAEGALALATQHAADRVQFGQPIGTFQAVRHLLAWAYADCSAMFSVIRQAASLDEDAPVALDQIAKAIAGRNGRRVCERALQVLGGIGFTIEHDHHHHHGRVLALDSILGTSAELTASLGASFRTETTEAAEPGLAAAVLVGP